MLCKPICTLLLLVLLKGATVLRESKVCNPEQMFDCEIFYHVGVYGRISIPQTSEWLCGLANITRASADQEVGW